MENIKNKYSKGYLNGRINNRIIASVNILPLKEETFNDIYENKMNEADVESNQIEKYEDNHSYYIFIFYIN